MVCWRSGVRVVVCGCWFGTTLLNPPLGGDVPEGIFSFHDRFAEKGRERSARHRHWNFILTVGRQDLGETVRGTGRIELRPVPVRSVHKTGHGLCGGTQSECSRRAARHDSALCRRHRRGRSCSMMSKLLDVPVAPIRRMACSLPSRHAWEDREREALDWQHKGGEQGDPFMPLLFSLAIHNALVEVLRQLWEGNSCSHTSMTCTSFQSQTAPAHFTTRLLTGCTPWQKLARGTLPESALPAWPGWGLMCGASVG